MNYEEVREIVKLTIDELISSNIISDAYPRIKKVVEEELRLFFSGRPSNIGKALNQLSDDPYLDIIFFYYRDGKTLEFIAEYFDKDVTTISRNKKRLLSVLYTIYRGFEA